MITGWQLACPLNRISSLDSFIEVDREPTPRPASMLGDCYSSMGNKDKLHHNSFLGVRKENELIEGQNVVCVCVCVGERRERVWVA